jgi:hypothetical protein
MRKVNGGEGEDAMSKLARERAGGRGSQRAAMYYVSTLLLFHHARVRTM